MNLKRFFNITISTNAREKHFPWQGWGFSPTAFGGCKAPTRQGPWGWTPAGYTNKVYSHLSAVAKEQGPGLCVVRFSNKYRNIYSSYLEKQTSGSSAKSNRQQDACSLCVYLQWGNPRALHCIPWISLCSPWSPSVCSVQWVAAALFSAFLPNCRNSKKLLVRFEILFSINN